ncbi:hypothetical protein C2E23DRAFT_265666 [Lenzites betulinus]|nr:hypothetical protein C2E23DRAFT_265818 [Lenzites betulinus]KAH9850903.1 hypothetical protein C2E23DRAFT_265666 [Lenzites betulinus]
MVDCATDQQDPPPYGQSLGVFIAPLADIYDDTPPTSCGSPVSGASSRLRSHTIAAPLTRRRRSPRTQLTPVLAMSAPPNSPPPEAWARSVCGDLRARPAPTRGGELPGGDSRTRPAQAIGNPRSAGNRESTQRRQ